MIDNGHKLEKISEGIATLRTELKQNGSLGLTNIHKQCENFVKHLLNLTYRLKLINLNEHGPTFPGLDLGSKEDRVAYQVTSIKTSNIIDERLDTTIRYKHYQTFPSVKFFILGTKQSSYSMNVQTDPYFVFDWKKDIVDFDDLLRDLQNNDHSINAVYEYMHDQLPSIMALLKNPSETTNSSNRIIDIVKSLKETNTQYFEHLSFRMRISETLLSVPKMHEELIKFFKKNTLFLPILTFFTSRKASSQFMLLSQKPQPVNSNNRFVERGINITENSVTVDFARYSTDQRILTDLTPVYDLVGLLLFFNNIHGSKQLQIEFDFDLVTNSELYFDANSSSVSILSTFWTYWLHPSVHRFSKLLKDIENESLLKLIEDVVHGFVLKEEDNIAANPYLEVNRERQIAFFNAVKTVLQPPLSEL